MKTRLSFLLWMLALMPVFAEAQSDSAWIAENYSKAEYMIPMRDGVKLHTVVYAPKSDAEKWPFLIKRTPYSCSPYGEGVFPASLGPNRLLMQEKFIFVTQDVRGRYMSEGEYVNVRPHNPNKKKKEIDESSDTYDTVEWLLKHIKGNNGNVGIYGISYPGFYTAAGIIGGHPAIKAASPQAPVSDWFIGDDFHHNGALFLPHFFNFISGFGAPRHGPTTKWTPGFQHPTHDGYKFFLEMGPLRDVSKKYLGDSIAFWNEVLQHPDYDAWWQERNINQHLSDIRCAVMTVGGWFDAENCYGALNVYKNIETKNPGITNILVEGPWVHGGWYRTPGDKLGDIHFGSRTSEFYQAELESKFFNYYLKGKGDMTLKEANVFATGSNRWMAFDAWPPDESISAVLFLKRGASLSWTPPSSIDPAEGASTSYTSDPAKPVPYINTLQNGMAKEYMTADQRFAGTRPDVIVFRSEVLTEDITVCGPVGAELFISSTGTDADFVVKLIDEYPDSARANPDGTKMAGYQMLVRGEPFRAKYRNSFSQPSPLAPGVAEKVAFSMPDVLHTFKKGHRMVVQVQSSWFPLVDRNPQVFTNIYNCGAEVFKAQTQTVYHSAQFPSLLKLRVLPRR